MKFPKVLYVAVEGDKSEEWLVAGPEPETYAVNDTSRPVARYVLEEVGEVHNRSRYVGPHDNADELPPRSPRKRKSKV